MSKSSAIFLLLSCLFLGISAQKDWYAYTYYRGTVCSGIPDQVLLSSSTSCSTNPTCGDPSSGYESKYKSFQDCVKSDDITSYASKFAALPYVAEYYYTDNECKTLQIILISIANGTCFYDSGGDFSSDIKVSASGDISYKSYDDKSCGTSKPNQPVITAVKDQGTCIAVTGNASLKSKKVFSKIPAIEQPSPVVSATPTASSSPVGSFGERVAWSKYFTVFVSLSAMFILM